MSDAKGKRVAAEQGQESVNGGKPMVAARAGGGGKGSKGSTAKGESGTRGLAKRNPEAGLTTANVIALLDKAVEKKAGIEVLERLTALQVQAEERIARRSFFEAMAAFQRECPVIRKSRAVYAKESKGGGLRYRFAPIDEIVRVVAPLLARHGFSYTTKVEQTDNRVTARVEAHHIDGHAEVSSFAVPLEADAYMSDQQKVGSARTFALRYAFCDAFGIVTGDQDDDGKGGGNGEKHQPAQRRAPASLPADPDLGQVEAILKQMPWLPAETVGMYRKHAGEFAKKLDTKSLRGLLQSLNKQRALKEAQGKE